MRKRVVSFLCVMLLGVSLRAQEQSETLPVEQEVTIEACESWALSNYPAVQAYGLLEKARKFTLSNIGRTYVPEFSLSGTASWQSEKMELDLDMPDKMDITMDLNGPVTMPVSLPDMTVPVSDQDRYNVSLSLKQALWAGGRVKAGKLMADKEVDMRKAELDVQLYQIKDKVKQLYFGLLTIEGREQQLDRADEIIDSLRMRADVALKEGVIYETDLDVIEVERIKYRQMRTELEAKRKACLEMLSMLTGHRVSQETRLVMPVEASLVNDEIKRPELAYLESKGKRLEADMKMLHAENMPKVGLFAMGGYGKSGLNTFDTDFKPYFVGGVMVSWNFGKLNTLRNDRKLKQVERESVDIEEQSFIFNTKMEALMQDAEIQKLRELVKSDEETVALRESIRKASEVKYANGVCTVSELISDVNHALIAQQEKLLREVELRMAIYTKKITLGL